MKYSPSVPPPGYAPPQYPQQTPYQNQGFAQVPQTPYGYATPLGAPPAPAGYGYNTAANSHYGTQVATDPAAYYATSSNGQGSIYGYTLGPGDKIRVSVFGEEDLSGEYQIDSSGMVRLPLIGTIRAAGFTSPSLENAIAAVEDSTSPSAPDLALPDTADQDANGAADNLSTDLADIVGAPVDRPSYQETTALGAAFLAGWRAGLYPAPEEFSNFWGLDRRFTPGMSAPAREKKRAGWRAAVAATLHRPGAP